jgi:hypothetical protein
MADPQRDEGNRWKDRGKPTMRLNLKVQENVEAGSQLGSDTGYPTDLAQPRPPTAPEDGVLTCSDEVVHVGTRAPQFTCELVAENGDPRAGLRLPQGTDEGNCAKSVGITPLRKDKEPPSFQVRNT